MVAAKRARSSVVATRRATVTRRLARVQASFGLYGATESLLRVLDEILREGLRGRAADDALRLRGLLLAGLDRHHEATAAFRRAIRRRPGDHGLYLRLGISLCEEGRYRSALRILAPILDRELERNTPDELELELIAEYCADALEQLDRKPEAIALADRVRTKLRDPMLRSHLARKQSNLRGGRRRSR